MNRQVVFSLFGGSLFEEYNINPPWEKIHTAIMNLYFLFLAIFGVHTLTDVPACLPSNTKYAEKLTVPEAKYVSDRCEGQHDNIESTDSILLLLAILVYLKVATNLTLEITGVRHSFSTFARAEKDFKPLEKTGKTGEKLFERVLHDPFATELRKIAKFISKHEEKNVLGFMLLRDGLIIVGLFSIGIVLWLLAAPYKDSHTYSCHVEYDFNWSSNSTTNFTCERSGASECFKVAIFISITLFVDLTARGISLVHLIHFYATSKPNTNIPSARSLLLVNYLSMKSHTEDERTFHAFVQVAFSEDAVQDVRTHLCSTGSDKWMQKFAPLTPKSNVRQVNARSAGSQRNGDKEPLVAGGKRGENDGMHPDAQALARKTRWKWVVFLVNKNRFNDDETLKNTTLDEDKKSLPFYAVQLARERKISAETAVKILKHHETVLINKVNLNVEQYVESQFVNDVVYQEQLKDYIIKGITTGVQGGSSTTSQPVEEHPSTSSTSR